MILWAFMSFIIVVIGVLVILKVTGKILRKIDIAQDVDKKMEEIELEEETANKVAEFQKGHRKEGKKKKLVIRSFLDN